ncbi:hypothetical protein Tco_0569157 [Tanacetum coccineum]
MSSRLLAFTLFFLHVDVPVSGGVVTGIDISEDFQSEFESFLLINLESVEGIMLVYRIPELMHVHFRDISSDDKCRIAGSECKSIQNNLKCLFFWFQSTRDSSIAFSNDKSILFGNKLKIKLGLLSSDGSHDYAKSCHIQFIYKQIYITLKDNLDHDSRLLMQDMVYNR